MSKRSISIEVKNHLVVSIGNQTVTLHGEKGFKEEYPVSTSKNGAGEARNSYRTPRGWHAIVEMVGSGEPLFTRFTGRISTEEIIKPGEGKENEDYILSRIFRLAGIEEWNKSSYDRLIYFHGTDREDLIGTPVSHGCIRMRNKDILELSMHVTVGTLVKIEE